MDFYPDFVCMNCGTKYGRKIPDIATWHVGRCDLCGKKAPLTEPRDFGHLTLPKEVTRWK